MVKLQKVIIIALALAGAFGTVKAQRPIRLQVTPEVRPDSIDLSYYGRKNPWIAAGEVVGFNMGIWAIDRYIHKADYAYINAPTILRNCRR